MLRSVQIFKKNVVKLSARKLSGCSQLSPSHYFPSNKSYPYKFLVGTGFIGKPPGIRTSSESTKQNTDFSLVKFPHGTDIAKWTLETMRRQEQGDLKDIGEDFFFVQTVCFGFRASAWHCNYHDCADEEWLCKSLVLLRCVVLLCCVVIISNFI